MSQRDAQISGQQKQVLYSVIGLATGWSLILLVSTFWDYQAVNEQAIRLARINTEVAIEKDIDYRNWVASKGGVYVEVTDNTLPNPYIDQQRVPNRDIETKSGQILTLINPAYMAREVHEYSSRHAHVQGHLTSLNPLRPENKADAWEAATLAKFETGVMEYGELVRNNGRAEYRFMKALLMMPECVLCHAHQGYQLGDIRGGISATVPMDGELGFENPQTIKLLGIHGGIWIIGLLAIIWRGRRLRELLTRQIKSNYVLVREAERRKKIEVQLKQERDEQISLSNSLKGAQSQLVQSEKLAVIGTLSAGIAHEINNPTGYVLSNLKSLKGYFDELKQVLDAYEAVEDKLDDETLQRLNQIKNASDLEYLKDDIDAVVNESNEGMNRIKKIVADLKDFAHANPEGAEWQYDDLHKGLDSTINLVWNELKYKAKLEKYYCDDLPMLECDIAKLNQVFMNLLVNASHAIEKDGLVKVRTRVNDDYVVVEIEDNGGGIAADQQASIFDPFFTTKPVGKGTGLGLSIAKSIIDAHHGQISLQSEVGVGTVFTISLPIKHKEAPEENT